MERDVFAPLGMTRTAVTEDDRNDDDLPRYAPRNVFGFQLGIEDAYRPDYSCVAGAGAFLSSPSDLVRLGSAMLRPGLLKAETISAFQTPTRLASGAPTTYALGWTVGRVQLAGESVRMLSHRGSPMGGSVSLLTFPDLGLAVAAATNAGDAVGVNPFARQVAEVFTSRSRR
jgi:CubicO group peptidase (beta-lactamase class C family)